MLIVFNSDFVKERVLERTETSLGVKKTGSLPPIISLFFMIFFWLPSYSTWGWFEWQIDEVCILVNGQHQHDISNDGMYKDDNDWLQVYKLSRKSIRGCCRDLDSSVGAPVRESSWEIGHHED